LPIKRTLLIGAGGVPANGRKKNGTEDQVKAAGGEEKLLFFLQTYRRRGGKQGGHDSNTLAAPSLTFRKEGAPHHSL